MTPARAGHGPDIVADRVGRGACVEATRALAPRGVGAGVGSTPFDAGVGDPCAAALRGSVVNPMTPPY